MKTTRYMAAAIALALAAASCSSRDDETATTAAARETTTSATAPAEELRATDTGITADEIRVAVIADVDNPIRPGVFELAFDGMRAWEAYVNDRGGIAGRRVKVDFLDSKLNPDEYRNAVITACENAFAVVGGLAVFDGSTDDLVGCGLPDIPANAISAEHRTAPNSFAVNPSIPGTELVGAFRWFLDNVDGCCAQYTLVPNQPIARETVLQGINAADEIGFTRVKDLEVAGEELNYTPFVLELENVGATYVRSGLDYVSTVRLRKEAAVQGVDAVAVWDCLIQCYTPSLISEGGSAVEGQYVSIQHNPFEDAGEIPAMQAYLDYSERTRGGTGSFGLNAFAAGLLFEQVANEIVGRDGPNGLTRQAMIEALPQVEDFTADGLFGPIAIGARQPPGCFVLLQVQGGEFVRVHPAEPTEIDCSPENLHETHVVEPGGR